MWFFSGFGIHPRGKGVWSEVSQVFQTREYSFTPCIVPAILMYDLNYCRLHVQ